MEGHLHHGYVSDKLGAEEERDTEQQRRCDKKRKACIVSVESALDDHDADTGTHEVYDRCEQGNQGR